MVTRDAILSSLQDGEARFTALRERLSVEELQRPFTPEGWSVKDFLAHMTHWKRAAHALLVAYVHDQPLPAVTPDGDAANEQQRQVDAILTLDEVENDWKQVNTYLRHIVVDELDDGRLVEAIRVPWDEQDTEPIGTLIMGMCEHDVEHFQLIEGHFYKG